MNPAPEASNFPGPLDYSTSSELMNDGTFRGRIKVALVKFATSIQNEPTATPAHNSRFKWAQTALVNVDYQVNQFTPPVVLDPAIQSAGDTISDSGLQGAVETAVQAQL